MADSMGVDVEDLVNSPATYGIGLVESIELKSDGTYSVKVTGGEVADSGTYQYKEGKLSFENGVEFVMENKILIGDGTHLEK